MPLAFSDSIILSRYLASTEDLHLPDKTESRSHCCHRSHSCCCYGDHYYWFYSSPKDGAPNSKVEIVILAITGAVVTLFSAFAYYAKYCTRPLERLIIHAKLKRETEKVLQHLSSNKQNPQIVDIVHSIFAHDTALTFSLRKNITLKKDIAIAAIACSLLFSFAAYFAAQTLLSIATISSIAVGIFALYTHYANPSKPDFQAKQKLSLLVRQARQTLQSNTDSLLERMFERFCG